MQGAEECKVTLLSWPPIPLIQSRPNFIPQVRRLPWDFLWPPEEDVPPYCLGPEHRETEVQLRQNTG